MPTNLIAQLTARVVYHELGARLQLEKVSASELGRLIDRVLKDSSYSTRVKLISERLVTLEHQSPGVAVIEDTLCGKISPRLDDLVKVI